MAKHQKNSKRDIRKISLSHSSHYSSSLYISNRSASYLRIKANKSGIEWDTSSFSISSLPTSLSLYTKKFAKFTLSWNVYKHKRREEKVSHTPFSSLSLSLSFFKPVHSGTHPSEGALSISHSLPSQQHPTGPSLRLCEFLSQPWPSKQNRAETKGIILQEWETLSTLAFQMYTNRQNLFLAKIVLKISLVCSFFLSSNLFDMATLLQNKLDSG